MSVAGHDTSPLGVDPEETAPHSNGRGQEWIVGGVLIAFVVIAALLCIVLPVPSPGTDYANESMDILQYLFGRSSR
jgi:hypothetical protein